MSNSQDFTAVAIKSDTARLVFINRENKVSPEAENGATLRMNYLRPYDTKYPEWNDTVPVARLPLAAMIPQSRISAMVTGKVEEYAASLGFASPGTSPVSPCVAVWMVMKGRVVSSFEVLYGGQDLEVIFPMSKWMGVDRKNQNPDTMVSLTQKANDLKFRANGHITNWELIQEK